MRRRKTAVFFVVLGISLSAIAAALNIGWILLNLRQVAVLVFGVIFFALIITGLILNTIFLVREIRRNEQHDAFLNAVTHELKTPIASIRLYLETLKTRDLDETKRREFYDVMMADNERLLGTVEQVLEASRTREKRRQMELVECSLDELLAETVEMVRMRHHLPEDAIRISAPAGVRVLGDRAELVTVFANLLENAVKYSPEQILIAVKVRDAGKRAEIYVKDHGTGIARGELKRIFRRFYRVAGEGSRTVKGTGLGLAIVQSIVARHGGTVTARSDGHGRGSTFVVRLPKI